MNSGDPTSGSTGTGAISLTDPASTTDGILLLLAILGLDLTANIAQFNFGSPPYSISSGNSDANGYGNFEYSVPSGYYALIQKPSGVWIMAYTTIDKPTDYFNTVLYTGNGSSQTITDLSFQPDWIWFKERSVTGSYKLNNSVRGSNYYLISRRRFCRR